MIYLMKVQAFGQSKQLLKSNIFWPFGTLGKIGHFLKLLQDCLMWVQFNKILKNSIFYIQFLYHFWNKTASNTWTKFRKTVVGDRVILSIHLVKCFRVFPTQDSLNIWTLQDLERDRQTNDPWWLSPIRLPLSLEPYSQTLLTGGSDRGSYFIPKKSQLQNLSTQKYHYFL